VYAGWKNARQAPNAASIKTSSRIVMPPVKIRIATARCSPARTASVASMIFWRGSLSAHTPPSSISVIIGSDCAASTSPRSVADPVLRVMNSASATITTWSPIALAVWPRNR
jgi:hypothetical protein